MLYAQRFPCGSAHDQRVETLHAIADYTRQAGADPPFRFARLDRTHRTHRTGGTGGTGGREDADGTRLWYVVGYAGKEVALQDEQVELMLLGIVAGLAVSGVMSPDTAAAWTSRLTQALEEGCLPQPWTA